MKYTAESRWFYKNSDADDAIKNWFRRNGKEFTGSNKRTDHYLLDSPVTRGIKLRDDRLEIKLNAHDFEEEIIGAGNVVKSNSWKKYSFELAKDDEEARQLIRDFAGLRAIGVNPDWIRLDKERLTVKYATDPDAETVQQANENETPAEGCTVDYTTIDINLRERYLSFGFEAFGNGMFVKKSLDLAMREVFREAGIGGLRKEEAMSFPEFIARG